MDLPGDDLLAGAALALDQHRHVGLADLLQITLNGSSRIAGLTQIRLRRIHEGPRPGPRLRPDPDESCAAPDDRGPPSNSRLLEGLREIVGRTEPHRLDDRARLAHHRHHQHRQGRPCAHGSCSSADEATRPGHHHVEHHRRPGRRRSPATRALARHRRRCPPRSHVLRRASRGRRACPRHRRRRARAAVERVVFTRRTLRTGRMVSEADCHRRSVSSSGRVSGAVHGQLEDEARARPAPPPRRAIRAAVGLDDPAS